MPTLALRVDGTLQQGVWSIVGPPGSTLDGVLRDDDDLTYAEVNRVVQTDQEIAKLTIQDIDIPDRAKIFAVRQRIRVQKIPATPDDPDPPVPHPHCGFHRRGFIAGLIWFIFRILFGFRCPPKKPQPPNEPPDPPEWTTVDLAYYTEQPGGGEWTEQSFNDFFISLGRTDTNSVPLRISEVFVDLDYNESPVITVTGPQGPLTDITLPTITWAYEDPESDKQQAYWVRIFEESVFSAPGFDAETSPAFDETLGWVKGEDNFWTVTRDLPNGTYRAYVIAEQVWSGLGSHRSEWAYHEWVQAVPGPPEPALTATYDSLLHRVRLDMHEGGPTPPTDRYNLEYSDKLGAPGTWKLLWGGLQIAVDEAHNAVLYDYFAPSNRKRLYRATAFRILNSIPVVSGFSNIAEATPETNDDWVKDPFVPERNMRVRLQDLAESQPRVASAYKPLVADENGPGKTIVVTGPPWGWEGSYTFGFFPDEDGTETAWERFQEILNPGRTLLIQFRFGGTQRFVRFGSIGQTRLIARENEIPFREVEVPFWEVDDPIDPAGGKGR